MPQQVASHLAPRWYARYEIFLMLLEGPGCLMSMLLMLALNSLRRTRRAMLDRLDLAYRACAIFFIGDQKNLTIMIYIEYLD